MMHMSSATDKCVYDKYDVSLCREGAVQWRSPAVGGDAPAPREFHTLTPLTKGRLMLLGGDCPYKVPEPFVSHCFINQ